MATNPSAPGGNPPSSGNGAQPSTTKPRATIVLKNPNAKQGSSPSMAPASSAPTGNTQRLSGTRPAVGAASQSARKPAQVQVDRAALGLSSASPSEMIAGLDEAAKRAEAVAMREEAKRKSGGKMSANTALHVDDTGRKWAMRVMLGIAAAVVLLGAIGALMLYTANHTSTPPKRLAAETRDALSDLEIAARKMTPFEASETLSVATVKARLQKSLEEQLAQVVASIQHDAKEGRNPDKILLEKRDRLINRVTLADAWGKPFEFGIDGDDLTIHSVSKSDYLPPDPVKVRIRAGAENKSGKMSEKAEK